MKRKNDYEFENININQNFNINFVKKAKDTFSIDLNTKYQQLLKSHEKNSNDRLSSKIKQLSIAKILVSNYNYDEEILIQSYANLAKEYKKQRYTKQAFEHFKNALDTFQLSPNKKNKDRGLKLEIYRNLITNAFDLKNYHQTLNFIKDFNKLKESILNASTNTEVRIPTLIIEHINAKCLFALGDFKNAEMFFLNNLKLLNVDINDIEAQNINKKSFDKQTFIFNTKNEIYDFLYKIKKKENKNVKILEFINKTLFLCDEAVGLKLKDYEVKRTKLKALIRKIKILRFINKFKENNSEDLENEIQQLPAFLDQFVSVFTSLVEIYEEDLFKKTNSKLLKKGYKILKEEYNDNLDNKNFSKSLLIITVIKSIDKFINGPQSIKYCNSLFIFIKCAIKNKLAKNLIYKSLKQVIKISKQVKQIEILEQAKYLLTVDLQNHYLNLQETRFKLKTY